LKIVLGLIPAAAIEDKFGGQLDASIAVDARRRAGGHASCRRPRVAECRAG